MFFKNKILSVLCGAVVGVALAGALFSSQAEAQRPIGAYYITQHSNPNAIAGVFRVNQATGAVSYCFLETSGKPSVVCTAETQ